MTEVRAATAADRDTLLALWERFAAERPPPGWLGDVRPSVEREVDRALAAGGAYLAERDGRAIGYVTGWPEDSGVAYLSDLWVEPGARRDGVATDLVRVFAASLGADRVHLQVGADNRGALAFYERLGFRVDSLLLVVETRALSAERRDGPTFGSIHVQSDDEPAVERAVRQFVPRLPGRSRGTLVAPPRNGWIAVYDDACDRDPKQLQRLARELSDRMGCVVLAIGVEEGAVVRFVLYDRGTSMDEYLSVQEYYGPLPPGDVIALAANPTVVSRLTGADPAAVRAAAVHGPSPADLPPAADVLAAIAAALGVTGTEHGYAGAPDLPGATRIER